MPNFDYRKNRWEGYKRYHVAMMKIGDCDPAYPALTYVADRMELNLEQRFWLAWLYSASYCAPTAYFMISDFPDYENVDPRRLQWWWDANKPRLLFQTDRSRVKTQNQLVRMFRSYRKMMGESQVGTFMKLLRPTLMETYDAAYSYFRNLYYYGRYSLFLYLEAVNRLTGFPMEPTGLEFREALSCRNGMCYALGQDSWVQHKAGGFGDWRFAILDESVARLRQELKDENPDLPIDYWNIETSLCAYKKLFWNTRYLGYYIDRQMVEIKKMEPVEGVDWSVLWDFRREFFSPEWLGEVGGWNGIRTERLKLVTDTGQLSDKPLRLPPYKRAVEFPGAWSAYEGQKPWERMEHEVPAHNQVAA